MCLNWWKCKLSTLAPICLAAPQCGLWELHVRYPLAIPRELDFARRYTRQKRSNLLTFEVIPNQFSPSLLPHDKQLLAIQARQRCVEVEQTCRQLLGCRGPVTKRETELGHYPDVSSTLEKVIPPISRPVAACFITARRKQTTQTG